VIPFALMLRSVAALALRRVSKHVGAERICASGPTSSFETRPRKRVRAPQDEVGMQAVVRRGDK
jgi:hypothetical protein